MLSIVVVAALFGCAFAQPDPNCGIPVIQPSYGNTLLNGRIVGGKECVPYSWPWTCQILYNGGHYCGGSLVNMNTIVSAAHCFFRTSPNVFTIRCGIHHKTSSNQPYMQTSAVSSFTIHESYNPLTINNDVAIIRLSTTLRRTDQVLPVCLPSSSNNVPAGTNCHATGWGGIETSCCPNVCKQAQLPIIDTPTCNQQASYGGAVTAAMCCAGYMSGGHDTCQGDSGGPLVYPDPANGMRHTLVGITSWGSGCADPNKPGVYANVAYLSPWILNNLRSAEREEAVVSQKFRPIPFGAAFREMARDLVEKGEVLKSDLPGAGEWLE